VLKKGRPGEVYNIGGSCEKTNRELTDLILRLTGKPKSLIKRVKDRPGHDRRYALDTKKIEFLGWKQRYDFMDALKLTIDWYIRNETWWQRVKEKSAFKAHYQKWYRRSH